MTQFSYLEKWKITFLVNRCKEDVDPINNYMVRHSNKILKLIDIYKQISDGITTVNPKASVDKIIKVSYFKEPVTTIIKKMAYTIISRKYKVYQNKSTIWTDKLDNKYVFDFFEKQMNYNYLNMIFKEIELILETRITMIFT